MGILSVVLVLFSLAQVSLPLGTDLGKQRLGYLSIDFTHRVEWDEDWVKFLERLSFLSPAIVKSSQPQLCPHPPGKSGVSFYN